jgi:hypothetical protein
VTKEQIMSTTRLSLQRPCVVCHVDASSTSAKLLNAAGAYCRKRDAELLLVWVIEPSSFGPAVPYPASGTGIWGLSGAVGAALEHARGHGLAASVVVRIGDPRIVLEDVRRGAGAERVFTRTDAASSGRAVSVHPRSARLESEAA